MMEIASDDAGFENSSETTASSANDETSGTAMGSTSFNSILEA